MRTKPDSSAKGEPESRGRVLVVDDHAAVRESVIDVLRQAGYEVSGLASAVEALPLLERAAFDVVVTDLQMPAMDGLEFIRQMSLRRLPTQVIMITAHATIASAVEAMRFGAFDYLEKPFDVTRLEELVARAMDRRRLCGDDISAEPANDMTLAVPTRVATPRAAGGDSLEAMGMIGDSPAMRLLRERIRQVGPTDETVLICGESGTGKELVARAVHSVSRRAAGPLVSLNCPSLSPQLAESELFGHRRGAFTGADVDRVGRFELAKGGAILLDEITEIDMPLQAKLLRVLQERTFELVGASETRQADVRVIASTNRDLMAEIAGGRFREDLYYRLAVVPLELPPLRSRGDDVQLLADHFLDRAAKRLGRPRLELTEDCRNLLAAYHWPGNVRELENIITRACVLSGGVPIAACDIRPWLQQPEGIRHHAVASGASATTSSSFPEPAPAAGNLDDMERAMIVATLQRFGGNRGQTAAALGIGVRTLSGKLRSYGFAPRTREFGETGGLASHRQFPPIGSANIAVDQSLKTA
ncbi:sigma-54-dependent transcriptional regulator [Lacipirellula sp.]|uniref:sigma-54-dependent transcriptional regulator n=1 Tax=Lacipirellula sp. TaxID=2691419 RepID=UPI003D0DC095